MSSIFGTSLSFPPRVGADGRFVWSSGEDNIRESIAVILKTEPGERVGVPEFGAGLARFLFEPNNPATHARMRDAVQRALARWERRIEVEAVEVAAHATEAETAVATITYRLVATASRERISLAIPLAVT
ncbi:GPW/gp25 family protein [Lysobacter antibioticus]|jgi:phage baseplate assembly protein W|uniref:Gene 25-like lysozyme family protein n=1 Tax=Lysobacter antibioticus TaxID=84531 RepID=A0A0S2FBB8_LYSAN|nr:GPW/gp25 family protein [Lysobacter antibioticus]ALN80847.1 gene 25-like lysozyme family protein [Lysobacter antibioticus]